MHMQSTQTTSGQKKPYCVRCKPDAVGGKLRREPPGDYLSGIGRTVATLLVMLGLAGGGVIAQALLSPKQSDYTYVHVAAAVIAVVIGLGAAVTLLMHWRCNRRTNTANPVDGDADAHITKPETGPSLPTSSPLHTNNKDRFPELRQRSVKRISRIDGPGQISMAEYVCLWFMAGLGGYGVVYQVLLFVQPQHGINEHSVIGSPIVVLLGILAVMRLHSFHRSRRKSCSAGNPLPASSSCESESAASFDSADPNSEPHSIDMSPSSDDNCLQQSETVAK